MPVEMFYLTQKDKILASRNGQTFSRGLSEFQDVARKNFLALEYPTRREEEWKYTDLKSLLSQPFSIEPSDQEPRLNLKDLRPYGVDDDSSPRLVFVNGRFSSRLSNLISTENFIMESLGQGAKRHPDIIQGILNHYEDDIHPFGILNQSVFHEGAVVIIPKNYILEKPIQILYVSTENSTAWMTHPRNFILAEAGSRSAILELYVSFSDGAYFNNVATHIVVEEGAQLRHDKVQRESIHSYHTALTRVIVKKGHYSNVSVALGGALARYDLQVELAEESSSTELSGLYWVQGRQHVDHHTSIDHVKPHGKSVQLYKGILDGESTGVFNGKVIVRPDAQKTDARQTNQNLILSEKASVDAKPQLEIRAHDVQCSHGAAVGPLDPEELFYLKSRGLSAESSQGLLIYGFARTVIEKISGIALQESLNHIFLKQFLGSSQNSRSES